MKRRAPEIANHLLLAVLLLAGPKGCGSDDSQKGAGAPADIGADGGSQDAGGLPQEHSFSVQAFCAAVAEVACELQLRCNSGVLFNRHRDMTRCQQVAWAACATEAQIADRAVAAGAATYSPHAARACLDALGGMDCEGGVFSWGLGPCLEHSSDPSACSRYLLRDSLVSECLDVFGGSMKEGEPCFHGLECGPGLRCSLGHQCPGECVAARGPWNACTPWQQQCAQGMDCVSDPPQCTPLSEEGEPCTREGEGGPFPRCHPHLSCLDERDASTGVCRGRKEENTGCGDEEGRCQPSLFCLRKTTDAAEGWCNPPLARGEICDLRLAEPPGPCGLGSICYGPGRRGGQPYYGGTCQPLPRVGEPCVRSIDGCEDSFCALVNSDMTGWCQPYKEVGEPCALHAQCGSGVCHTVCVQASPRPGCLRPEGR